MSSTSLAVAETWGRIRAVLAWSSLVAVAVFILVPFLHAASDAADWTRPGRFELANMTGGATIVASMLVILGVFLEAGPGSAHGKGMAAFLRTASVFGAVIGVAGAIRLVIALTDGEYDPVRFRWSTGSFLDHTLTMASAVLTLWIVKVTRAAHKPAGSHSPEDGGTSPDG